MRRGSLLKLTTAGAAAVAAGVGAGGATAAPLDTVGKDALAYFAEEAWSRRRPSS